jgi:4-hydroxymandelate oxidase
MLNEEELQKVVSVGEFERLAGSMMDQEAFAVVRGSAGQGWTAVDNRRAFRHWQLVPRVLRDVSRISTATTVLATPVAVPVLFSPSASQKLASPTGELAAARAAAAIDTIQVLSTYASTTLEDVAAAGPKRWLQLYWFTDWGLTRELVERATAAGYSAIALTVDAPVAAWRDHLLRNPFTLPSDIHEPNTHDRLLDVDSSVSWSDLGRLRSISSLPLVLKGILHPDDGRRAVDAGASAIIVSNHGGRQLDGAIPSIDALPQVAEAVSGRIEVLMDGGVRRGTDVLKALGLGARAVLIGRPVHWALAVGGEFGVRRLIELISGELRSTMAMCGCASTASVDRDIVRLS